VVDDGSADGTAEIARRNGAVVVRLGKNNGVGRALRTGFEKALKDGAKWVITLDADGQHDPSLIPVFIEKAERNNLDVVFGRRIGSMPLLKRFGNGVLNLIHRILFFGYVSDSQCGFRLLSRQAIERLALKSDGYEIISEIVVRTMIEGLRYGEVDIPSIYFSKKKGTTVLHGVQIALHLLKWRLCGF
ncbi:MAG: glycosyltransferase family 2 protein, partial [Candidatus Micrarchaeia archaeon]